MNRGIISRAPQRTPALVCWCFAALVACSAATAKGPGDGFNPGANGNVTRIGTQADGKLLVSGEFGYIGGGQGIRFARLHADGRFDSSFITDINGTVTGTAQLDDGRVLVHGFFTQVDGVERFGLAMLGTDGKLDPSFTLATANFGESVTGFARQKDGKIVVAGSFSQLGDKATWAVARLNADGSLDETFATPFNHPDWNGGLADAVAVQPDGKIIVVGYFEPADGSTPLAVARLNADGTLDDSFAALPDEVAGALYFSIRRVAVQGDGGIVMGGAIAFDFDGTSWSGLLRLQPDGTLDTGYTPLPDGAVDDLVVHPDGRAVIAGPFTEVDGQPQARIARLRLDGSLDPTFDAQANAAVRAIGLQGDGKLVLGGSFSQVDGMGRSRLARLERDGSLEVDFIAGADSIYPGLDGEARCLLLQPDGALLAGCGFSYVGSEAREMARLRPDGSIDPTFNAPAFLPAFNNAVSLMALQPDGRVVIGGRFTSVDGNARHGFARLMADGTLDAAFAPADWSTGNNGRVFALALQPDGKILMAGYYNVGDAPLTARIARYNTDGTIDAGFVAPVVDSTIDAMVVQPDGRILIAGFFSTVNGTPRPALARLHGDGSLDESFVPALDADGSVVQTLQLQPDGSILVAGNFSIGGTGTPIARLHDDGSLDTSFQAPVIDGSVLTLALQTDGALAIGGTFRSIGGVRRLGFARLHADGSLDTASNVAIGMVTALAQQQDGKLFAAGAFADVDGLPRLNIVRLRSDGAAVQTLSSNSAGTLTWTLGGSMPAIDQTVFDLSLDGTSWTRLGEGTRLVDGFQLAGASLPRETGMWVRAQGIARGGEGGTANGSSSLLESVARIRLPATTAVFTVTQQAGAGGQLDPSSPLSADEGAIVELTVLPDAGHALQAITGCGGVLDGLVYRTAPLIADCIVSATFTTVQMQIFADDFEGGDL
jgi:uncharacterized delta-60 repeat protein